MSGERRHLLCLFPAAKLAFLLATVSVEEVLVDSLLSFTCIIAGLPWTDEDRSLGLGLALREMLDEAVVSFVALLAFHARKLKAFVCRFHVNAEQLLGAKSCVPAQRASVDFLLCDEW